MIDYSQIKETLRAGIWDSLGVYFVELENGDPRPDNQPEITEFVSHKITSPYIPGGNIETYSNGIMKRESSPTMTLSLTCYSRQKEKALNLATRLRSWFEFRGYQYLKDNSLIVANIEATTDRTTFLETHYDNRVGFDVILRVCSVDEKEVGFIELVELNETVTGE